MKKKYKALILDVDGTLVPNKPDGMPSQKVTEAISKASKKIHIGVGTSRPYYLLEHIVNHLKLTGPSIINGGAQIININSRKVFWEKTIDEKDYKNICQILKRLDMPFFVHDGENDIIPTKKLLPKKIYNIGAFNLNPSIVKKLLSQISYIPTIVLHKTPAWEKGKISILISHASVSKQFAIFEIAKLLGIETHEIIGVGDGYNDFPLLMACGLKIAMGNAVPELKEIADYIAPPVEKDGVADIIERFVL